MKTNLKKASQNLRDWLNKTEKTTGLEKSIIVTGILMIVNGARLLKGKSDIMI